MAAHEASGHVDAPVSQPVSRELTAVDVDGPWGGIAHQTGIYLPLAPSIVVHNIVEAPLWYTDLSVDPTHRVWL